MDKNEYKKITTEEMIHLDEKIKDIVNVFISEGYEVVVDSYKHAGISGKLINIKFIEE